MARAITSALKTHTKASIALRHRTQPLAEWISDRKALEDIPIIADEREFDVVLRIGTPKGKNSNRVPTVIYTQNALGDLLPEWVQNLSEAEGIIVPGEFDAKVFRKYFSNVHCCPQYTDHRIFSPKPKYRSEGTQEKSFFFVGSYSYRKGVDLLLDTFSTAFHKSEAVHLALHCFSGLEKNGIDDLVNRARKLPENVKISVFSGSITPPWMSRFYNRHDALISFSRGEGWCMPLHEGLLSGKPVIAPNSTAMGEMLPSNGVRHVQVTEQPISSISSPLGRGMRDHYDFPGNSMWNVCKDDAIAAVRDIYNNTETFTQEALIGRDYIIQHYSHKVIAEKVMTALHSVL